MQRKIVDYSKLTSDVLDLLVQKFPDGYGDDDVMKFKNAKGETVRVVEVIAPDTIYLVKISVQLVQKMEDYSEEIDIDLGETDIDYNEDSSFEDES